MVIICSMIRGISSLIINKGETMGSSVLDSLMTSVILSHQRLVYDVNAMSRSFEVKCAVVE